MKILFIFQALALILTTYTSRNAFAGINPEKELSRLSKEEHASLEALDYIFKTEDIDNSPWPVITYYKILRASPLASAGLFAAYDIQKDYVPNILQSEPIKHISPTDVHTRYELKIPFPLPNAHYVHGARIFKYDNDYEVSWYLVESSSALEVRGSAYFKQHSLGSILIYQSYVKPKSIFANLVKKMMFKDVETSIKAIVDFTEKTSATNPLLTTKYSEFITRALQGEFVYQSIILKK